MDKKIENEIISIKVISLYQENLEENFSKINDFEFLNNKVK